MSLATYPPKPPLNLCKHAPQQLFYFGAKNSWERKQQSSLFHSIALLKTLLQDVGQTLRMSDIAKAIEFRFQLAHFQLCDSRTTERSARLMWKVQRMVFQKPAEEICARLFRINTETCVPGSWKKRNKRKETLLQRGRTIEFYFW